jgi:hypothetical protein
MRRARLTPHATTGAAIRWRDRLARRLALAAFQLVGRLPGRRADRPASTWTVPPSDSGPFDTT